MTGAGGWTGQAVDLGYLAGWSAVKYLPERAARAAFAAAAEAAYRRRGAPVRQLRDNLGRVAPSLTDGELDDLTRQGLHSYARYWCEVFRLPRWSTAELDRRMVSHHLDRLVAHVATGRGVVAVLGHVGNWDHVAAWAIRRGFTVTTVAERLQPEQLFRRFLAFRESIGLEVLASKGDPRLSEKLQRRLRAGGVVALVADRDLTRTGVEVGFLDGRARMPAGPAILALRTGAVLVPAWSWYDPWHTHLEIGEELVAPDGLPFRERVLDLTQQFADGLAEVVREHPQDWHVLQPVWTDRGPGRAPNAPPGVGVTEPDPGRRP